MFYTIPRPLHRRFEPEQVHILQIPALHASWYQFFLRNSAGFNESFISEKGLLKQIKASSCLSKSQFLHSGFYFSSISIYVYAHANMSHMEICVMRRIHTRTRE